MNKLAFALLAIFLSACGTTKYVPQEYELTEERIPNFDVRGKVAIENIQTDQTEVAFFSGPLKFVGDYKTVTDHLVTQLNKEIGKHGNVVNTTANKTIQVKVVFLEAVQPAFHFTSKMKVLLKLGNGTEVEVNSSQGSPGNMWRVLNGTIAIGVIDILKNKQVLDYLAN